MQPTNGQPTDVVDDPEADVNSSTSTNDSLNSQNSIAALGNVGGTAKSNEQSKVLKKADDFKEYVASETDFFITYYQEILKNIELQNQDLNIILQKRQNVFASIVELIESFKGKFDASFERWKKQVLNYGEIYFDNDRDRLNLSMCSSRFTNDDHNTLTPFGRNLVVYGELIGHHQIGVLDALQSQLARPNLTLENGQQGLITAQIILILMYEQFISFCEPWNDSEKEDLLKNDWRFPPLIQFSDSNTGAWAADRETPTILHVNRKVATKLPEDNSDEALLAALHNRVAAYAAFPHEFAHDIMDTFKEDKLVKEIQALLEEDLKNQGGDKKQTERSVELWNSWMHELVADAIGDGILHTTAIKGLKHVLLKRIDQKAEPIDMIIENFDWDRESKPYDEHPNSFLRVLISIEFTYQLHKDSDTDLWKKWKVDEWDSWLDQDGFEDKIEIKNHDDGDITIVFKDQKNRDNAKLESFPIKKSEIEKIAKFILTAEISWFPEGFTSLQDLIHHISSGEDVRFLLDKFEDLIHSDLSSTLKNTNQL